MHSGGASPHECGPAEPSCGIAGSNTMNFCRLWVAPLRDLAVLAVTNQGGDEAQTAADEAVAAMIRLQENR